MYDVYGPGQMLEDETRLYDLQTDPGQERPPDDPTQEGRLARLMVELMQANHAPPEAYAPLQMDGQTGACLTAAE